MSDRPRETLKLEFLFHLHDGFARHSYSGSHHFPADGDDLSDAERTQAERTLRTHAFRIDCEKTIGHVESCLREKGISFLDFIRGSEERRRLAKAFDSELETHSEICREWYILMIYRTLAMLKDIESISKTISGGNALPIFISASHFGAQLGALCREFELSEENKSAARSGRLDARRRSDGGKARKHEDHDLIVAEMEKRCAEGQSVRQAAKGAYNSRPNNLGTSITANISLFKRHRTKKSDRS